MVAVSPGSGLAMHEGDMGPAPATVNLPEAPPHGKATNSIADCQEESCLQPVARGYMPAAGPISHHNIPPTTIIVGTARKAISDDIGVFSLLP